MESPGKSGQLRGLQMITEPVRESRTPKVLTPLTTLGMNTGCRQQIVASLGWLLVKQGVCRGDSGAVDGDDHNDRRRSRKLAKADAIRIAEIGQQLQGRGQAGFNLLAEVMLGFREGPGPRPLSIEGNALSERRERHCYAVENFDSGGEPQHSRALSGGNLLQKRLGAKHNCPFDRIRKLIHEREQGGAPAGQWGCMSGLHFEHKIILAVSKIKLD
jgi:hypothetical protein